MKLVLLTFHKILLILNKTWKNVSEQGDEKFMLLKFISLFLLTAFFSVSITCIQPKVCMNSRITKNVRCFTVTGYDNCMNLKRLYMMMCFHWAIDHLWSRSWKKSYNCILHFWLVCYFSIPMTLIIIFIF